MMTPLTNQFAGRRSWLLRLATTVVASLTFGGAVPTLAALPPAPDGVVIQQNVRYLNPPRNVRIDLYLPANRPPGTLSPGVVIIHGGGWSSGSKSSSREFEEGTTLAKAGYVCASIDYVLEAHDRWPTNVYDCKNAVRFLRTSAEKLGVDADRIGVIGGSAGGHLALMVGMTTDIPELEPHGADTPYPGVSDRVSAVVDMYGLTDFHNTKNMDAEGNPTVVNTNKWNAVFGDHRPITDADRTLVSPAMHIGPHTPPLLILHGDHDTTVDRDQSIDFDKKLTAAGVTHQFVLVPGVGHTFDLETWNHKPLPMDLRPVVIAFLDKYVKAAPQETGPAAR